MKNDEFFTSENTNQTKKSSEENIILPEGTEDVRQQRAAERARNVVIFKYIIYFGLDRRRLGYLDHATVCRNDFSPPPSYYIHHIFYYLREHMELTENKDYKRIYKEARDYLVLHAVKEYGWKRWKKRKNRKTIEHTADLWNTCYKQGLTQKFTKEQVDEFLEYRKIIWY